MSIDTEKVFDSMEIVYLQQVLSRMGFGKRFKMAIKELYSDPFT